MSPGIKKHAVTLIVLLLWAPFLLPVAIVALILIEELTLGTRYFGRGLEALGLTPLLEAIFNRLGMNG